MAVVMAMRTSQRKAVTFCVAMGRLRDVTLIATGSEVGLALEAAENVGW